MKKVALDIHIDRRRSSLHFYWFARTPLHDHTVFTLVGGGRSDRRRCLASLGVVWRVLAGFDSSRGSRLSADTGANPWGY